jgi:hypothetical protein
MVNQPKNQYKTDVSSSDSGPKFGSKSLFFWKNHTLTKKVMGSIFRSFAFFAYGSAVSDGTQNFTPKSCCKKITKQKTEKRTTTKSPKKTKKMGKHQKNSQFMAGGHCAPIRVNIHVCLNFAINDVISQSISSKKLKRGTRAVILHSVLAPADTCSTCGVRLKFASRQLGFQGFESQPVAL